MIIATYGGGTDIKSREDAVRRLRDRPELSNVTAIQQGRIIPIDFAYLVGAPLAVEELETIADELEALG